MRVRRVARLAGRDVAVVRAALVPPAAVDRPHPPLHAERRPAALGGRAALRAVVPRGDRATVTDDRRAASRGSSVSARSWRSGSSGSTPISTSPRSGCARSAGASPPSASAHSSRCRVGLPAVVALLFVLGAPLLAFLVLEQQVAGESARWQRRIFLELPVVTEQLGMLLSAGYSLGAALNRIAPRGRGACGRDLARVCGRIRQGLTEVDALREWARHRRCRRARPSRRRPRPQP